MTPPSSSQSSATWPWALALLSGGVTAAQVALMQVLAYVQWHHFAYLVVSVALLGFGASGTVLTLARARLLARVDTLLPWLLAGCGAGFAVVVALLQTAFLRFDLYLLFVEPGQWFRLTAACVLLAAPFFCAGLANGLMLTAAVERAGRLYAANLIGAGAGALGGLALVQGFEPAHVPALTALAPLAGAFVLTGARRDRRAAVGVVVLIVAAIILAIRATPPAMSPFKDLARTLDLPEARIVHSQPGAQGWLQIVEAPALRAAPPASLAYTGRVPQQLAVFIDGNRYGSILAGTATDALDIFAVSVESLPWRLGSPRRVLLLHDGAGGEAAFARSRGAEEIVLVEPHRALARVLQERSPPAAALQVIAEEPRLTIARHAGHFDLIRFPTVGAFGGSAGLRAVGEEFLLTREAIASAWRGLAADGTLLVTAWMDHPERAPLRLLTTLRAGLADAGVSNPSAHLAAVRGWASVTFLLRTRALGDVEVASIRAFCDEHGFDPLLLPGLLADERARHHAWDNPGFFALTDAIVAGAHPAYPFRLDAPTDNRPYFSQFLRLASLRSLADSRGWRGLPFFELGSVVVAVTFGLLVILAAGMIVLPLTRTGWSGAGRGWTLVYFGALGAGFMLLEIVLMQRLTPFAGGPIPAAAIVLATLLVAAGIGSHWSQRWPASRTVLMRITGGAAAGTVLLGSVTGALSVGWDAGAPARAVVCVVLVAPVAWVLGLAFPTGLRFIAAHAPAQVPWAVAINSCVSVVTPSLATMLAVSSGYPAVFGLAAGVYAAAALATWWIAPRNT